MFLTSNLRQCSKLSLNSETKVVFNENIEFFVAVICNKDTYNFDLKIEKIKGNFSNLRIASTTSPLNLPFNVTTKTYQTDALQLQNSYSFVIECEVEYKIVSSSIWSTILSFSSDRLKFLNIFECYQGQITIADYENYKLDYFVKKVGEDFVEITVKNPHKIQINGQKEEYNVITIVTQSLTLTLTFVFDPKVMELLNEKNHDDAISDSETSKQISLIENQDESCTMPENDEILTINEENTDEIASDFANVSSDKTGLIENDEISIVNEKVAAENANDVVSTISLDKVVSTENDEIPSHENPSQKNDSESNENTVTFEDDKPNDITTNDQNINKNATSFQLTDYVILISSDGKRIFSFASILTRNSYIFATLLKKIKKSPVKINIEEFDGETIYAALDFLNGKVDAIKNKELQLYYFAEKYSLRDLKNVCCKKFDEILCPKNVCEIIQIAYANYFEELKLKCIEMIRSKTEEIDESELKGVPKEIYSEIF